MEMSVPSGRTFYDHDVMLLQMMACCKFIQYSGTPFLLRSKVPSNVYVFGRDDLTDHPNLGNAIGHKILHDLAASGYMPSDGRNLCLIGIPTAGTALAAAASLRTHASEPAHQVGYRIMREQKKSYGAHQAWVNGKPDLEHQAYVLVDNVATDGQSKIEANIKVYEDGYPSHLPCYIFIDRQQGAIPRLQAEGFKDIVVGYNLLDVTYAYGELGLWPKETVEKVQEEIAAHDRRSA